MLEAKDISYHVGVKTLLQPTSLQLDYGEFVVVMGANGAGKSTLLKILAGELKPGVGTVSIDGLEIHDYNRSELARKRAVLSQHYNITFPISVHEVLMMGRYPYFKNKPSSLDYEVCRDSALMMDVQQFADRDIQTLSGGEAQKVQMSRVLAQVWPAGEDDTRRILYKRRRN